ncbi:MAG: nucleotide exchange factor GrpE [Paludibacteraceae bacterium]
MSKKHNKQHDMKVENIEQQETTQKMQTDAAEQAQTQEENVSAVQEETEQPIEENPVSNEPEEDVEALKKRIAELEDVRLRQMAEFDNYRRRTNKEKLALMETAGEKIFTEMLSLVDDFERAQAAMQKTEDINSLREGIDLIYNKFITFLGKHDVHALETENADFNTDEHEAVTTFAAGEDKKGKVIDCTQKGYKLGDKVIRFAKVVVGE